MDIGSRFKKVRKARALSQRELAARAGMTNGVVSQIEQDKSSPSIATLKRLLDAIPMSLSEFFAEIEGEEAPKYFYAASEFTELSPQDAGRGETARLSLRQLGDASTHTLQMLHETYAPGGDTGPDMMCHEGEEAGVVLHGVIEITVAEERRVLNPGDGYLFDSRLPHRFRNIGDKECEIVSACTPPTF